MRIILVMVVSANGKITAGGNTRVRDWSSKEDQAYFAVLKEKSRLIIMGRKTYDAARDHMTLSPKTLRIVLTKNPERFARATVPGQLEFTKDSPKKLLEKLERRGYREALLVGGAEINAAFLRANLVSGLWLTVEPVFFGRGKNLFSEKEFKTNLHLKSVRKLNKKGTLLLKYFIEKVSPRR